MITLLLTLFISLFSICPFNYQVEVHNENNVKRSIDYWETGNNELVLSSGYTTNYQELACEETWQKIEDVFGTVYSEFNYDYASWSHYQSFACSGLYVQIPPFFTYDSGYENTYNYINSNYSSNQVTSIILYNRRYYPWSNSDRQCYAHAIDFIFNTRFTLEMFFYKSLAGVNECSYAVAGYLYEQNVSGYTLLYTQDYSMFATNSFTYADVFKTSSYWSITEEAEQRYQDGYTAGYENGVEVGKTAGETTGYGEGYQVGYNAGLDAASSIDSTAATIFQGIFDVGLLPVNVFLTIFNFEVFGVNIAGVVSGLLTLSVVIIIIRFLLGGKKDD